MKMSDTTVGIFVFDGPLYKDIDGVYCSSTITNEMLSRFFTVIDELFIVIRVFEISDKYCDANLYPLNTNHMRIIEAENMLTPVGMLIKKSLFEKKVQRLVEQSDMIFARMPSITSNSVLKIARRLKKPYLVEVGGCAWDSYWNHSIYGKILAGYVFWEERKYVAHADFATYVTKKFLQERYPNKRRTINASNVYLNPIKDSFLDERIDKICRMDLKNVVIGQAVNSIDVRYKGEQYIIRAMPILKKRGIHITYQITGSGNGTFLKNQAKRYGVELDIQLMGTMNKDELCEWYKSIDLYAQPSKQEGLPRSVIEAMSTGCPAVGSNIAGIPELLDQDCLFDPDNNKEIVEVIEYILNRDVLLEKAKINFNRAKEYNLKDIEAKRQKLFKEYSMSVKKD